MISSSPVSSLCVYKLFSSSSVWSRTWCMPRFSSLALDNFSVDKKSDIVKPQSSANRTACVMPIYSPLSVCLIASHAKQHRELLYQTDVFHIIVLVKLCIMQKFNHITVPFNHRLLTVTLYLRTVNRLCYGQFRGLVCCTVELYLYQILTCVSGVPPTCARTQLILVNIQYNLRNHHTIVIFKTKRVIWRFEEELYWITPKPKINPSPCLTITWWSFNVQRTITMNFTRANCWLTTYKNQNACQCTICRLCIKCSAYCKQLVWIQTKTETKSFEVGK